MPDNVWTTPLGQATLSRMREQLPDKKQQRMYAGARVSRLTGSIGSLSSSANSELYSSLQALRDRSRQLVRDSAYAKRARQIVVDNVIGTGIGMQPGVRATRGELRKTVNQAITDAFWEWCCADSCHTGGQLHFCDLERQAVGQVFEAGEIIFRLHYQAFGRSKVPLAIELIEPERLADSLIEPTATSPNTKIVQGIEVDRFYRPVAYWIRMLHPGEHRLTLRETDRAERVPASEIIHLRLVDRWPQVRGVPWLHAVIGKLADINGYTEAEIIAARAAAMYFGTIETLDDTGDIGEEQSDGSYQLPLEPGMVEKLKPGEKLNFVNPNRPNSALDPFLRYMLREMASGIPGVSYESLSADYSQSNYSSSRMALLETRDAFRAIQQWFIRDFRERLHKVWLQQAMLAGAVEGVPVIEYAADASKFEIVAFKPRGWSWIDPTKEVDAYKEAIKAGLTTVSDVIALTDAQGRDAEEVFEARARELEEMAELDLRFDTSPEVYDKPDPAPAPPPEPKVEEPKAEEPAKTEDRELHLHATVNMPPMEVHNHVPPSQVHVKAPITVEGHTFNVPAPTIENRVEIPATTVNVENRVETPSVNMEYRAEAPVVNVAAPIVNVENRVESPTVNVAAPEVHVDNHVPEAKTEVTVMNQLPTYEVTEHNVMRDANGRIEGTMTTRERADALPEYQVTEQRFERDDNGQLQTITKRKRS